MEEEVARNINWYSAANAHTALINFSQKKMIQEFLSLMFVDTIDKERNVMLWQTYQN